MKQADRYYLMLTIFLVIAAIVGGVFFMHGTGQAKEITLSQEAAPQAVGEVYIGGAVTNPGIYSLQEDDTVQDLVVVGNVVVVLAPAEHRTVTVRIACASMANAQPTNETEFKKHVGKMNLSTLGMLVQTDPYQEATFRVQQFALWLLIDHPETRYTFSGLGLGGDFFNAFQALFNVTEDQLGMLCLTFAMYPDAIMALPNDEFLALSVAFTASGIPIKDRQDLYDLFALGIPTKGELAQIYSLFKTAGIDPTDFPVLAASTEGTT